MKFVQAFIKNVFIAVINSLEPRLNLARSVAARLLSNCVLKTAAYKQCVLRTSPIDSAPLSFFW